MMIYFQGKWLVIFLIDLYLKKGNSTFSNYITSLNKKPSLFSKGQFYF